MEITKQVGLPFAFGKHASTYTRLDRILERTAESLLVACSEKIVARLP